MEKNAETSLLSSFQQATLDERRWFELYTNLLNYGNHTQNTAPTDITSLLAETIEFKEQITAQWRLLNHVFDSLPFAVLFLDKDYQIVHYNKKATSLYYQPEFQQFLSQSHHQTLTALPAKKPVTADLDLHDYHPTTWQQGIYTYYLNIIAYPDHPTVQHILYAYRDKPQLSTPALTTQFGLTESESRTLQAIIEYGNTKETADQLAISHETVRTHLKSILRKTHTHSQNELLIKLFSGSYWLGEIQAFYDFEKNDNKTLLHDLVYEPFVMLGKKTKTKHLTLIIPSFFGVVWDFIEENASQWQHWCDFNDCPILVMNTHQIIPATQWKTQDLPEICQTLGTQLQVYLSQNYKKVDSLSLVGIHTGAGFALNLSPYLPYAISTIKLISPILPLPYMRCEQIRHAEYHSAKKAQKIPKKIWYALMPHVITSATKDTQTYFQKRLDYQQYEADKQKVRHWLNHAELGELFANYCQLAHHKIAFDVLQLHRQWQIPPLPCLVQCIAGSQDIYTSIDSIHAFASAYPKAEAKILEDSCYSLSRQQWQMLLSPEYLV